MVCTAGLRAVDVVSRKGERNEKLECNIFEADGHGGALAGLGFPGTDRSD